MKKNKYIFCIGDDFVITYASIEDAKRAINGKPLKYIPEEAEICGEKFWSRFK